MPKLNRWFVPAKHLEWEKAKHSFIDNGQGPEFFTYPAVWLLPRVPLTKDEIANAPTPLWIIDIDEQSEVGTFNTRGEGTFIIDLTQSFESYIEGLAYDYRKKMRYVLRKNEDLTVKINQKTDIAALWDNYVSYIQGLNLKHGEDPYTDEDLALRKEFYLSENITSLSLYSGETLLAVNLSIFEEDLVFDLAALINPDPTFKSRSVGTFATLKNIELAINSGKKKYDLLTGNCGYKTHFGAKEQKLRHFIRCSKEFAAAYKIPVEEVHELI